MALNYFARLVSQEHPDGFPLKEDCTYTPHFCEENIWMLVKKIEETYPEKLTFCYPVFISNEHTCIPLWRQSVSKQEDGLVVWDYHVVMVYFNEANSWVFDFDTQLPFLSSFSDYCKETFKSDEFLNPLYHRFFRVITAESYLKHFSSDRRHMKNDDGTWTKPPPNYPAIRNSEEAHNLSQYISMKEDNCDNSQFGIVLNLNSFIDKFTIRRHSNLDYTYPPEPLQPNWLE